MHFTYGHTAGGKVDRVRGEDYRMYLEDMISLIWRICLEDVVWNVLLWKGCGVLTPRCDNIQMQVVRTFKNLRYQDMCR